MSELQGERLTFDNNFLLLAVCRQLYEGSNNIFWQRALERFRHLRTQDAQPDSCFQNEERKRCVQARDPKEPRKGERDNDGGDGLEIIRIQKKKKNLAWLRNLFPGSYKQNSSRNLTELPSLGQPSQSNTDNCAPLHTI